MITKLSELTTGMVVKLRNGNTYVVMKDCGYEDDYGNNVIVNHDGWLNLDSYDEDMLFNEDIQYDCFDIMEVYKMSNIITSMNAGFYFDKKTLKDETDAHLVFKRPMPRKMHKEEIETILGYEIEIVD